MFEALPAGFDRKATDGEPAQSRQLKRAKKVLRRHAIAVNLNRRGDCNGVGGGAGWANDLLPAAEQQDDHKRGTGRGLGDADGQDQAPQPVTV
jgi:hypothetical protein